MPNTVPFDLLPSIWRPSMGKHCHAIKIPVTTPTFYVSYSAALNLREPGEFTGDWHADVPFVISAEDPRVLTLAGPGGWSDTTPSLGSKGVRDKAHLLEGKYVAPGCGPIWVANHFRAIADYVMVDTAGCWCAKYPRHVPVYQINQWLNTRDEIEHLVEEYLKPLRNQLTPGEKEIHDGWLPTVVFT